ncbi:hypothetical protein BE20_23315 [Sorangium cellulosum]|nr:hypothetical protein BE20_23315 [Sorangium cellulosum]
MDGEDAGSARGARDVSLRGGDRGVLADSDLPVLAEGVLVGPRAVLLGEGRLARRASCSTSIRPSGRLARRGADVTTLRRSAQG